MTVATFNPNWDGIARYTADAPGTAWATIRGAATATAIDDTSTSMSITLTGNAQSPPGTNKWASFTRAIEVFDTSSLPDTAVISAASLRWRILAKNLSDATEKFSIVSAATAEDTFISVEDYNITGWGSDKYCTDITIDSVGVDSYITVDFNATGIAAINLTGLTKLGLIFTKDLADTEPASSADYVAVWNLAAVNNETAAFRPLLTVDYTVPISTSGNKLFILEHYHNFETGIFAKKKGG